MKFRIKTAVATACLGALVGLSGPAAAQKYIATVPAGTASLPTAIGVSKGYFKDAGLDLEVKEVARGSIGLEALAANTVHFSEGAYAPAIAAASRGVPLVMVGMHSHGFFGKMIASPENADLKRIEDFKGKEIGVQVGTGVHTALLMLIEKIGMKESDFNLVNVRVNDMPAARQSGRFDAVVPWEPAASRIVANGWGKEVISSKQFEERAGITYPFVIMTRRDIIEQHPDAVQRYLNGWVRAQRFMNENRDEVVAFFRQKLGAVAEKMSDEDLRFQVYDTSSYDRFVFNDADLADIKATAAFMHKIGRVDSVPDMDKLVDMSFARKAVEAIN